MKTKMVENQNGVFCLKCLLGSNLRATSLTDPPPTPNTPIVCGKVDSEALYVPNNVQHMFTLFPAANDVRSVL